MLFTALYEISLILVALAALPKILYMRFKHKKYKNSLWKRLGKEFPPIHKGDRPLIWIHAISVGETKVAASLVKKLKADNSHLMIVISSITETGHAEAKRSIQGADYHVFLPFDFGWIIKPIIKRMKPDLVVLCESDFWYNFMSVAKTGGAKIALVNGKISERSQRRFSLIPGFAKKMFENIDFYCIQNQHYRDRFEALGIPKQLMITTGNMKFDDPCVPLSDQQLEDWKTQLGIKAGDQVLVIGSTHDPEERLLLKALQEIWKKYPNLKVIIVPRHPERFNEVASMIQKSGIPFQRFTSIDPKADAKVILMDTMGLLRKCYQLADIAIVGGSFTSKVGGHNILEPSWFGVPVLFGPFMHQQPELVDLALEYGSGKQIKIEESIEALEDLLSHPEKKAAMGKTGLKMVGELNGATDKTFEAIKTLIGKK